MGDTPRNVISPEIIQAAIQFANALFSSTFTAQSSPLVQPAAPTQPSTPLVQPSVPLFDLTGSPSSSDPYRAEVNRQLQRNSSAAEGVGGGSTNSSPAFSVGAVDPRPPRTRKGVLNSRGNLSANKRRCSELVCDVINLLAHLSVFI